MDRARQGRRRHERSDRRRTDPGGVASDDRRYVNLQARDLTGPSAADVVRADRHGGRPGARCRIVRPALRPAPVVEQTGGNVRLATFPCRTVDPLIERRRPKTPFGKRQSARNLPKACQRPFSAEARSSDTQLFKVVDRRPHLFSVPRRPVIAGRQPGHPDAPPHGDQPDRETLRAMVFAQRQKPLRQRD